MSVIERDQCFQIEEDDGWQWVTELLHTDRGDVPKRWRIKLSSIENARRFIATRLRDGHNTMFHFHAQRAVGQ